jgi:phage shock protein A
MKFCALTIAALALLAGPAAAAPQSSSSCRSKLSTLQRENRSLRQKISKVTTQRDTARRQLAIAQSGVGGTIETMRGDQVWALFDSVARVFSTPRWSNSYFSSGADYASWTFTRCDFCGS